MVNIHIRSNYLNQSIINRYHMRGSAKAYMPIWLRSFVGRLVSYINSEISPSFVGKCIGDIARHLPNRGAEFHFIE